MNRASSADLKQWIGQAGRLPLVLRGARQVGKTWLVRQLAKELSGEKQNWKAGASKSGKRVERAKVERFSDIGVE